MNDFQKVSYNHEQQWTYYKVNVKPAPSYPGQTYLPSARWETYGFLDYDHSKYSKLEPNPIEEWWYWLPDVDAEESVLVAVSVLAELDEEDFQSFVESEGGLTAYIQQALCDENTIKNAITEFPLPDTEITYTYVEAEDKDWNEEWEKNFFQPIVIGDRCVIHSTFHQDVPKAEYDILINPQMAFGTGHHETTSLIIGELLDSELKDKSLLDMGCGTSILAILARMRGARPCTAIDIDEWCVRNSIENIELNHVDDIAVSEGDASSLVGKGPFDVIIANINRNILLNDMKQYVACMHTNSELYMSGFYVDDIAAIREEAEKNGLAFIHYKEKNRWAEVKFIYKG